MRAWLKVVRSIVRPRGKWHDDNPDCPRRGLRAPDLVPETGKRMGDPYRQGDSLLLVGGGGGGRPVFDPNECFQIRMAKATRSKANNRISWGAENPGHYDHRLTMGRAFGLAGSRSIEFYSARRLSEGFCCREDIQGIPTLSLAQQLKRISVTTTNPLQLKSSTITIFAPNRRKRLASWTAHSVTRC